jgi:tetratricopeptide (TPR) repeat protein
MSSINENPHLTGQLADYLLRYNQNENAVTAFEASFGMTPEDMDKLLESYFRQNRVTMLNLPIGKYEGEIVKRELDEGEKLFLLADLGWHIGNEETALEYLQDLELEDPAYAPALSLAAMLEFHKENYDQATKLATAAYNLAPQNAAVLTNLSHYAQDNFEQRTRDRAEPLSNGITYAQQAAELDPSSVEAYTNLFRALSSAGEDTDALRALMAAYQLEPSSIDINYTIGDFLIMLNRKDLAQPFLQRAYNWSHPGETREEIGALLRLVE